MAAFEKSIAVNQAKKRKNPVAFAWLQLSVCLVVEYGESLGFDSSCQVWKMFSDPSALLYSGGDYGEGRVGRVSKFGGKQKLFQAEIGVSLFGRCGNQYLEAEMVFLMARNKKMGPGSRPVLL